MYAYDIQRAVSDFLPVGGFFGMTQVLSWGLSIALYVLSALGLYTAANNRGISKPWLAWIPVVNLWTLGALSDQYRYVARGQVLSKRKSLLVLSVLSTALTVVLTVCVVELAVLCVRLGFTYGMGREILGRAGGTLICMAVSALALFCIGIAKFIIRQMALYDLYGSCDPSNQVLYLVLGIIFPITVPFFLFFNRNKELGMPPRRQTVYDDTRSDIL